MYACIRLPTWCGTGTLSLQCCHVALCHAACLCYLLAQVCEERVSELSIRLSSQESKVAQLKQERQELYQKLAAAAEASRTQVRDHSFASCRAARH